MSHTFESNAGTRFHFNSDLSGEITIQSPEGGLKIPAVDLLELLIAQIANRQFDATWLAEAMQNSGLVKIEVHNESILITRLAE